MACAALLRSAGPVRINLCVGAPVARYIKRMLVSAGATAHVNNYNGFIPISVTKARQFAADLSGSLRMSVNNHGRTSKGVPCPLQKPLLGEALASSHARKPVSQPLENPSSVGLNEIAEPPSCAKQSRP